MDPLVWLVLVVIGLPVVAALVMVGLAATADFTFDGMRVRGGQLRGAVAAALARVAVGDAESVELPLVLTLRKTGLLGAATPLVGGALVRGIEWKIRVDGEHVSTMTEAHPVRIGAFARTLELPVDAQIHPPGGFLKTYAKYRRSRRAAAELRIAVDGHVHLRHLGMRRAVPVHVAQFLVLGDPQPELAEAELTPADTRTGSLAVRLHNPYSAERLEGDLEIQVLQHRRLRRDPAIGVHAERLAIAPQSDAARHFAVTLLAPRGAPEPVSLRLRVQWNGRRLAHADEQDEPDPDDEADGGSTVSLVPTVAVAEGPPADRVRAVLRPFSPAAPAP